jgi:hypothetical protein
MIRINTCLSALCMFALEARGDEEIAPEPREAEILTVKPRETTNAPTPASTITSTLRDRGGYESPLGRPVTPIKRDNTARKPLDPARMKLLEELLFEEEFLEWERDYLKRFGHKGPETLKIEPRLAK